MRSSCYPAFEPSICRGVLRLIAVRRWSAVLFWGAALTSVTLLRAVEPPARTPHILLIYADDQRWDTIRALGNPEIHTPHLDRIVERGFHFTNAYCMGAMIPAVCTPSRTMLLTGRSLWNIPDPRAAEIPADVVPLPTALRDAGYTTWHCGKRGNSYRAAHAAFDTNIENDGRTAASATEHADRAIEFLQQHDGSRPFFMYLAPPVPHDPRLAPDEFTRLYDADKLSLSPNFLPEHPFDNGELRVRDELLAPHPRTPAAMRQHLADYYATISHLDHEVGRVLVALDERGWTDNTVIIFSSDQGLAVGGRHGLMGKQNLYEHFKSPLVIAGPGIAHGQSAALVYLFDLYPTICGLARARIPASAAGHSLLPIIQGNQTKVRDWLLCGYRECQRMIRDERWKLIEYRAADGRHTQLFDLAHDPDELHNLADVPKFATERSRLTDLLRQARSDFGDPVDFAAPAAVSQAK